ncbi:hypothetical protein N9U95_00935 [Candidatus Pelagibacter sp.]|nr:hypothetical protein [Candidatus Pelagibacter sp.]
MKKFLIAAVVLLSSITLANAEIRLGVSAMYGVFEADGAKEIFSGDHSSNTTSTKVTKDAKDEKENAEGDFGLGSVFAEFAANDQIAFGVSYVPHSSDSEEAENIQNFQAPAALSSSTKKTNKVKVSFEDLVTVYALANVSENVYLKAGIMQVELITKENLETGGAYGDTTLDGYTIGIGYNMDLDDGMFVRAEAAYMDIDGVTLKNSNDATKSVSADGITGYGAAVSVGKSF